METEANKSQKNFFLEMVDETVGFLSRIWKAPKRSDINFIFKIISFLKDRNLKKFDKFFPTLVIVALFGSFATKLIEYSLLNLFDYSNINTFPDFWNVIAPSFQEYDAGMVWVASVILKLMLFRAAGWIVSSLQAFWSVTWTIFIFFFTIRDLQENDISIYDFVIEKLRAKYKRQLANYEDFLLDDKKAPFVSGALITGISILFLAGVVWGIGLASMLGLLGNVFGVLGVSFFRVLNIGALAGGFLLPIIVHGTDKLYNRIKGIDSSEGIVTEVINTVNVEKAQEEIIKVAAVDLEKLEKEEEIAKKDIESENIKSIWGISWDAIISYGKTTSEKVSKKTKDKLARFKQKFLIVGYTYNILLIVILIVFIFVVN